MKRGRPTKQTDKFIKIAKGIIEDDINAIILTDEELVFLINEKLEEKERIDERTFERWKAKSNKEEELDERGVEFCRLIKKALIKQKGHLFDKFRKEPQQWTKWAWIIERKFDNWNIKNKTDLTTMGEKLQINISKEIADKNEI